MQVSGKMVQSVKLAKSLNVKFVQTMSINAKNAKLTFSFREPINV